MSVTIRIRRGTTTQWAASTKVLQVGELGIDTTLNKIKAGNGSSLWPDLPFIESSGNSNTADFIFTDDIENGQSIISLPGDKQMRIESGADSDLYLTAGDDLYIQTLGTGDDIHINAADDIRFSAGEETETAYFWRMDSEGNFQLPGDGYISNPIDSSGDPWSPYNDTIHLVPDGSTENDQYIILDPTSPNHIHIRAGGSIDESSADLILGGEKNNVVVSDSSRDVFINTRPGIVINSYTNLNESNGTEFIISATADIGLDYVVNVDGIDYIVNSITPVDEGIVSITANGAIFTAGQSYTFIYNPTWVNSWQFSNDGTLYGPVEGLIKVDGIYGKNGFPLAIIGPGSVLLDGNAGEFLNDASVPSNQIATIGDIITSYNDLSNKPPIVNAAPQWTANHSQLEGGVNTRYLAGDVVYDNGFIYVASYDNESINPSDTLYWALIGPGNRLNIDGRDIPNILWDNILQKPTLFDGDYNSLSNLPSLFSGSYNDLTDTPSLFDGNYNSLSNLPTLFSGSYNDLTDKPTLFNGSYNSLTDKPTIPSDISNLTDTTNLLLPKNDTSLTGTTSVQTLNVTGNLTVGGTTTTVNAQDLVVSDPLIYIGEDNNANVLDLGIVASFNDGTYQHTGLVKDATDGKWKLFKGVTDEPTTTVNFSQASLDALAVGALEASSLTVGSVSNTEIGYLDGVTSSIQSQIDGKLSSSTAASTYAPINNPTFTGTVGGITKSMVDLGNVDNTSDANKPVSTATQTALDNKMDKVVSITSHGNSYTILTSDLNKMIEMSNGGIITISDSALFPVGFTVDILQTGSSQVTIAGNGFTPNGTPGLKLRAQWSSATIIKRALNSWVVVGDLSA